MSEKERSWEKKMQDILKPLQTSIGEVSTRLARIEERQQQSLPSPTEGTNTPDYECKGEKCGFATNDLDKYIRHIINEESSHKPAPAPTEGTEAPKRRHETVEDYLDCPECFPKFEKAFLDRGYKKPEPEKAEKKPSEAGLEI